MPGTVTQTAAPPATYHSPYVTPTLVAYTTELAQQGTLSSARNSRMDAFVSSTHQPVKPQQSVSSQAANPSPDAQSSKPASSHKNIKQIAKASAVGGFVGFSASGIPIGLTALAANKTMSWFEQKIKQAVEDLAAKKPMGWLERNIKQFMTDDVWRKTATDILEPITKHSAKVAVALVGVSTLAGAVVGGGTVATKKLMHGVQSLPLPIGLPWPISQFIPGSKSWV